jgi:hypothetical protein
VKQNFVGDFPVKINHNISMTKIWSNRTMEKSNFKPIYIVIWGAISVHLNQAIALIYSSNASGATDMTAILQWIPIEYAPAVLISASCMAFIGLLDMGLPWYTKLTLLVLQQALIALAVSGVVMAIYSNAYADGTMKPGIHIYVDQLWLIAYFIAHIYAVERRSSTP